MNGRLTLSGIADGLRESLWFIPAIALVLAVLVAELSPIFDDVLVAPPWYSTDAESARALLGAIATATLTLTGLVFSITMLVLQLTSSQLSPRVMGRFLRDRHNQVVLALFISTFAYALLALRSVEEEEVRTFSVWVGFAMAMVSVVAFIHYIDHMAKSIRASTVIAEIATETRGTIERMYPDPVESDREESGDWLDDPDTQVAWTGKAGVVTDVDIEAMREIARRRGVRLALIPMVGDFVPSGAPVFNVWGALGEEDADDLQSTARLARERTPVRDVGFGFRQLVDIAERALSPGVNDPTTAVQAIDQIHDLLRRLATRELGPEVRRDDEGEAVAIVRHPGWDAFVGLAVDEIRISGQGSLQTNRRLRFLLEDVMTVAPPRRQNALRIQLTLLDEGLQRGFDLALDRDAASRASARGHGD